MSFRLPQKCMTLNDLWPTIDAFVNSICIRLNGSAVNWALKLAKLKCVIFPFPHPPLSALPLLPSVFGLLNSVMHTVRCIGSYATQQRGQRRKSGGKFGGTKLELSTASLELRPKGRSSRPGGPRSGVGLGGAPENLKFGATWDLKIHYRNAL